MEELHWERRFDATLGFTTDLDIRDRGKVMVLKGRSILPSWDNIILTFGTMVSISRTLFFDDHTRMRIVLLVIL